MAAGVGVDRLERGLVGAVIGDQWGEQAQRDDDQQDAGADDCLRVPQQPA
ncbi:hypothetical protein QFZ56_000882 [Streptomyces achromogenes]|uniref:Uncharacterized protein n=1 Tax=Streptomyces achromogenes TaxID=67255 RepID=A0ABU0PU50_STRAH|nr:hypothetical protein [Streptomyces achromogenes]MDQ0681919.1 hypothetical protein [Streptomyces achromogenes]